MMPPLPTKWIQKASAVIAAALGVLVAGGASGASTLSIIPDATTYTVGDTITLDIVGVAIPDPSSCFFDGCWSLSLFAELTLTAPQHVTAVSVSQAAVTYTSNWFDATAGDFPGAGEDYFTSISLVLQPLDFAGNQIVNQFSYGCETFGFTGECYGMTAPNPLATATFTATSPGQVTFGFNASTFDFFDAAPTSTATIEILPIPEPGTATLVGMGLASLSVFGRRRRHRRVIA